MINLKLQPDFDEKKQKQFVTKIYFIKAKVQI